MKLNKYLKNKKLGINNSSFSKIIFSLLIIFILFHFTIWNIYTKSIFITPQNTIIGDASRLSYQPKSIVYRKTQKPLFFNLNNWDGQEIDLLTIGDSFSNGGGGLYYQNFLLQNQNLKILNIQQLDKSSSYIETISILNNNGMLSKINPKSILIESVERRCVERLINKVDFNKTYQIKNISHKPTNHANSNTNINKISLINNYNYNAFLYNILYAFNDHAYYSKIYKVELTQALFTNKMPKTLLYYSADLKNIKKSTHKNIKILNNNLNKLARILKIKKINLYFMPVVDKYNLYSKFIKNNHHKNSNFFELLRQEKKDYIFIDTKSILIQKVTKKDIFWADDTHWNTKAIKSIFSNLTHYQFI